MERPRPRSTPSQHEDVTIESFKSGSSEGPRDELYLRSHTMMQLFEGYLIWVALAFIALSVFAFAWMVVHVEHARHFSKFKAFFALILGSLLMGFGLHFLLLVF